MQQIQRGWLIGKEELCLSKLQSRFQLYGVIRAKVNSPLVEWVLRENASEDLVQSGTTLLLRYVKQRSKVVGDVMVDYFVDVNQMLYLWMIICILFEQPGVLEEMRQGHWIQENSTSNIILWRMKLMGWGQFIYGGRLKEEYCIQQREHIK